MKQNTKEKLLETGVQVFLQKGYHGAGLNDILSAAGVPKGSFYHYFENKEAFLVESLDFYADDMAKKIEPILADKSIPAMERFKNLMEGMIAEKEDCGCIGGCLIGNMAQEMSDQSDAVRCAVKRDFEGWVSVIEAFLNDALKDGSLQKNADVKALANMFADGWQGAMLRMKIEKTTAPLSRFLESFLKLV